MSEGSTARTSYRRDAALAALARMAPLGVQLLATPAVLAAVGQDAYAAWALMMTTINLLLTADLGVVGIMQRYHGVARGRGDEALAGRVTTTVLAVLAVLLVVVTAAGPWLARLVQALVGFGPDVSADAGLLFRHAGTLAVLQLVALAMSSYLAAHGRFVAVAVQSFGARTVLAGGIAVALLGGHGLAGLLIASYADAAVAVLLGVVLCREHLVRLRGLATRDEAKDLWAYAWRNQASALGFVAQRELDVLMAGVLLPTAALASISATAPLTAAVCLAPIVLLTPLFTELSVQAGADHRGLASAAAGAERTWLELVGPFAGLVLGVLPFAARAWLGPELADVEALTAVLAVGFLLTLLTSVRAILVRAAGRPGVESRSYLGYAVLKIVVGAVMALVLGAVGLASAGIVAAAGAVAMLRAGSHGLLADNRAARPSVGSALLGAGLAVTTGAASWWVSDTVAGRLPTLAALAAVGVLGAGAGAVWFRRRGTTGTAR